DADDGGEEGGLNDGALALACRHALEKGDLVSPAAEALHVQPPELLSAGPIAQHLEGDGDLDGPAALEAPGLERPHRVPIQIQLAVRELAVVAAADGVDDEHGAAAPVVHAVDA